MGWLAGADVIFDQCHLVESVTCLLHEIGVDVGEDVGVWVGGNCGSCMVCDWHDQDCRRGP